jgi:hypothetical protein
MKIIKIHLYFKYLENNNKEEISNLKQKHFSTFLKINLPLGISNSSCSSE